MKVCADCVDVCIKRRGKSSATLPPDDGTGCMAAAISAMSNLLVSQGLICVDLMDMEQVLRGGGTALFASGEASGEGRASAAAEHALAKMKRQIAALAMGAGVERHHDCH
ncbi:MULTISPECIES: hypothetical protein [unclassified Azospirillum]|uniref:hypothetical protein n=1 Tax=unclassified Azospirillum TaxID=2630922 RepID=UPI000B73BACC|nr:MULTISPECIES: hypothetical protein [unclassified Azospirillum]SNS90001.1 hypothetical protein SAMN05880556_114145 [Azospirillum sp. RU38E]SNT07278.1 hypothetical protein SAMN05880591_114145 [Azospirillum sp. RU37A]